MGLWRRGQVLRNGRKGGDEVCLRGGCRVVGCTEIEVVAVVVMGWERVGPSLVLRLVVLEPGAREEKVRRL